MLKKVKKRKNGKEPLITIFFIVINRQLKKERMNLTH